MRTANKRETAAWRSGVGARAMAGLLALVMTLGLVHFALPEAKAADAKDYVKEQETRKAGYSDKFDMENLKWKTNSARNYMCWAKSGDFGGIAYKNYIHVFAFEGETITFGSSEANSTLDIAGTGDLNKSADQAKVEQQLGKDATVDIVLIDLDGNRILYDVVENGKGHIPDYQTEVLAKTMESVSGQKQEAGGTSYSYTPLTYPVHETGVYTFEFHSHDGGGFGGTRQLKNAAFSSKGAIAGVSGDFGGMVDAWDVSVFNEQGYKETGRVYADYLAFQETGDVSETYYVLTSDNYIYQWDFDRAQPNTYNFFANNQGLLDSATGSILYKSVKELENTFNFTKFGVTYTYPGTPDTELTKSYKIFFEMPDQDLEGYLFNKAVTPDPATNLKFVSQVWDGKKYIPGAYEGRGGWFQFDVQNATTATLRIEFKDVDPPAGKDPGFTYAPVEISGVVTPYATNRLFWDGRDGNGVIIPPGTYKPEDISWTVTTKAGEIHFPIMDVENTKGGFTFTRVSPVYSKDGTRLDKDNVEGGASSNIYTATKSVIYYDNSAIYYGEKVARTGTSEGDIQTLVKAKTDKSTTWADDSWTGGAGQVYQADQGLFYLWGDIKDTKNSESKAYLSDYRKEKKLRAGDHSHTSNPITYYQNGSLVTSISADQQAMIDWLDSKKNPVSISSGTTVSDFSIQNFWTFIPGQPVTAEGESFGSITIQGLAGGQAVANITGLVFYDNDEGKSTRDGVYNASQSNMDVPLSDVTVNLYRQTADTARDSDKTYCTVTGGHGSWTIQEYAGEFPADDTVYERVQSAATSLEGRVMFENQLYDATGGTKFVYEVERPNPNWTLTSEKAAGKPLGDNPNEYGDYALYAYDKEEKGTEVQVFTLGAGAVDPESNAAGVENHTATAIDVGYHYTPVQSLRAIKSWNITGTETKAPSNVVFELSYYNEKKEIRVYQELSLSSIMSWENIWNYLPETIDHQSVQYFISAEYYLMPDGADGTLYKHTFELDDTASELTYKSFVGTAYSRKLTLEEAAGLTYNSYDSLNGEKADWEKAPNAPFTAVLDRNVGTAETTVTITNSDNPGVIEILKYTGSEDAHNYLPGATFRLYADTDGGDDISLDQVQALINGEGDSLAKLSAMQVGSGSTRDNGRMTFSGLDPEKHYVIREVYPPAGYRAREVLYIVHPAMCKDNADHYHAEKPEGMEDDAWDTWQLQNLYFGTDDHALAAIANIPANGDMAIRKQLVGRAWNDNDAFTFDIAFRDPAGKPLDTAALTSLTSSGGNYVIPGSSAVRIPASEYALFDDAGENLDAALKTFLASFDDSKDLTVNNTSDTAEDTVSVHGMQDVKVSLPDTKQSVALIVNAELEYNEDGTPKPDQPKPRDALMNTSKAGDSTDTGAQASTFHDFPAAGTYTFTISENCPSDPGTTDYTTRVYTVTVLVTRVLAPGAEEVVTSLANSYLRADVQSIYYQEASEGGTSAEYPANYDSRKYYAGVAPTFANTYHVQPAVYASSYAIQVDFSGRLDDGTGLPVNSGKQTENWLDTDSFTVSITGDDEATQAALENGNIHIGGLLRVPESSPAHKRLQFNPTTVVNVNNKRVTDTAPYQNEDTGKWEHRFEFEELNFQDIVFPVKWVFSEAATVGGEHYEAGTAVPDQTETSNFVTTFSTEEEARAHGLNKAGSYFYESADALEGSGNSGDFHPVESRTENVVYHLTVQEDVPEETRGINYDPVSYSMCFTLKNTTDSTSSGAEDNGVIEETDLVVSRIDGGEVDEKYATCEIDQQVVTTFDQWTHPERLFDPTGDGAETKYFQYYINADHVIREVERETAADGTAHYYVLFDTSRYEIVQGDYTGSDRKIGFQNLRTSGVTFIVKKEAHSGNHTMVFKNEYQTQGTWTPTVTKELNGRPWQDGEEFQFTLSCAETEGVTLPASTSISIGEAAAEAGRSFGAVTFTKAGAYHFTIAETVPGEGLGVGGVKPAKMEITVQAVDNDDNDGNLKLTVTGAGGTAVDSSEEDLSAVRSTVHFVNTYDERGDFDLAIQKLLTGRDWESGETFAFTIAPDEPTKAALAEGGPITVPAAWGRPDEDGSYTVQVGGGGDTAAPGGDGWTVKTHSLGALTVGNLGGESASYTFTVREDTASFPENALYCRQPAINLTVNVARDISSGVHAFTATYAYLDDGEPHGDGDTPVKSVTLPFTNRFYVDTKGPGMGEAGTNFTVQKSFTGRPGDRWDSGDRFNATVAFSGTDEQLEKFLFQNGEEYVKWDAKYGDVTFTDADRSEAFDFRFFAAGEYKFTVSETKGDIAGVTYDNNTYTVTFTVAPDPDDGNRLAVTRAITGGVAENIDGGAITFQNTYTATGAWTPTVTKELQGRDWQAGETFRFTLSCEETDGVALPASPAIQVGEAEAEGGVPFGPVRFTKPGVYHFTIAEAAPGAGITAEAGEIGLTVTAVDQGDGTLSLTVTGTDGAEPAALEEARDDVATTVRFVNAYSESGDFPLSLAKRLTGRDWSGADAFSFTLTPRDSATEAAIAAGTLAVPEGWASRPGGAGYTVTLHGTAGGDETRSLDLGALHVGNLRGGAAAYTFTVQENTAAFDEADLYCAQPEIRLTLHANGQALDGALKFSATYAYIVDGEETDPGTARDALTLSFTNRYYADTRASDAGFQVNVSLTGRPGGAWLDSDRFHTTVAFAGSRDLLANVHLWNEATGGYEAFGPQQRAFTSPDQLERFDFRFLAEGDYPFTVTQSRGDIPGVRYDSTTYTVTFHVARTGGRLTVTRSVAPQSAARAAGDGAITFQNTYSATGSWTPTVTKRLQGRPWQTDETFQFTLACEETDGVALPASPTIQVGEAEAEDGVPFSPVRFTQPGTYHFTITETGSGAGLGTGEEQANGVIDLDVTAEDDTKGRLVLLVTGAGGASPAAPSSTASTKAAFVNTYDEGGQFHLALSKLLTGRPWSDGETFSFTIAPDDLTRAAIGAGGPVTVPAAWGSPGGDGNYTVQVGQGDDASTRDGWTAKTHDLGTLTVGNLGGDGQRYSFTVTEDTSAFGGDLYCRQPSVQLTVTATRNTETGVHAFTAAYAYLDDSETHGGAAPVEGVTLPFTNHAAAQPDPEATGSSLTVGKALEGRDWLAGERYAVELRLTEGEMEQVRYSGDGGEYLALPASLTHTFQSADGSAPQDWTLDLRFYAEGDYVFTAREIQPDQPPAGIACDATTYTATFHVTRTADNGGKLVVRRAIASTPTEEEAADQVLFVNRYTPLAATWTPSVTKILNGRPWAANDSFIFDLALAEDSPDTEGVDLPADHTVAVTDPDQAAAFPPVTFSQTGTYHFTLRETNLGFDADAGAYPVTVTVTNDAATGKLSLAFAPEGVAAFGEETADGWRYATTTEFVNTFSQQPSQFTLELQKTLSGRAWRTDDVFSFTITPDEATQAALADVPAALELPAAWGEADLATGAYTVALSNQDAAAVDEVLTAALGTVHVNRTGIYRFTIEETASAAGDTYCPEPAIRLTVTAMPETDPNGVPNGYMVVTTFAHAEGGGSLIQDPASGVTTIPFTNHACDEIALTLNKTYTDVTDGSDKAWADGFFQAQVTLERADGPVSCGGVPLAVGHAVTIPLTPDGAEVSLRFLAEGDYELTVAEVPGAAPGVTYDPTRFTVAATVTADPATGQLATAYTLNGERADQITFANTYRETPITGGLTVTKTVLGEDPGARFRFTVTLSDAAVHGVYDGMTFQDGVAEFTLGDGEAVSASGLPAGVKYTVAEEETAGYTAAAVGATGRIPASGSVTAAFTNAPSTEPIPPADRDLGSLTVTKTVSGDTAELDREWHFTVTLGDPALDGTYGGMTFAGGVAHIALTGGHSVTATGLPARLSYTVVETEAGQDGYTTSSGNGRGTIPGGGTATASFINHRDTEPAAPTGGLSVSKTVAGALGDKAARWHFTVTLSGDGAEHVNGVYGGVTFRNGVAALTLGHGESQTIPGLPVGLSYEVTEREADQDGCTTSATAATGTIQRDRIAAAVFTNTKNPAPQAGHGHLTVVKTVTGNGGERDRAFPFTVTLSEPRTGVYDGVTFQDGVGVFSLASGQSVTLELPLGTTYTVTEEKAEGYTASSTDWTGIITDAPAVASFVNDRQLSVGDLTISNTVTGTAGDKSREWHFHLALGDKSIDGVYGGVTLSGGEADLTLKHGQSVTLTGLPAGVTYTVTEAEADQDGYKTTSTGATGAIPVGGAATAAFVNAKPTSSSSGGRPRPGGTTTPDETPAPDEAPAPSETPAPDDGTPVPDVTPAPDETPIPGETPAPDGTPIPEETPAPSETPIPGGDTPDSGTTPGGETPSTSTTTPDETPKTGDDSHLGLWIALLLLGAVGAAVALWPASWQRERGGKGRRGKK